MCACDGIEPSEALKRSRGGYRKQVNLIAATSKKGKESITTKNDKARTTPARTRSKSRNPSGAMKATKQSRGANEKTTISDTTTTVRT